MRLIRLMLLLSLAVTVGACDDNGTNTVAPTPTPTPTPTPSGATVSIPAGATNLGSSAYMPNPVTVNVGSSVTWTNTDTVAHTSTSNTGVFNSGSLAPGGTFSFTFQSAGTYPYHCSFHPGMVASVVVQ